MDAFYIQKYALLLCVIVSITTINAADTVSIPENLDDFSEYCVQLAKALDRDPSCPIGMIDADECSAFIILSGNARLRLKDRAWPAPQCVRGGSSYYMQIEERRRRTRCGLPELKKTYDTIIATVKSGWEKHSNSLEGWISFVKEKPIGEKEDTFITSVAKMFDLSDAIRCRHSGKELSLKIRQDKMQEVQEKMGFQLPEE